ncbi:ArdC-like ssDNA-binding domain-containing protein [Bradyrhizobium japonicum]|uniref:ArdC-like ssDNA-binding domain-containing protein n=1 Tax=Bradyrhizobium japonicum TaxID=375 RepID=UPI002714EBE1|nr:ArdC-like ssDNA-binding domain-containing protein [Bradyrhizobium japonicum]MCD9896626.1 ssDNA-binding domain-containing protein [Bradyrhizobium japonicum]MEB2671118.1 ArdC-like ssDNA-binding domain-containing protein [Bradyrhizobium japonicum]WLB28640.1 ArdC-like ssDNA-binding domain-containing protein [Bradyrhizobium japonicum]WRI90441.1 ArdC-like ssDNA-binding domain-containing protein [Bradyrhizobium japonicum]WRJ84605.1 ArdC-like ssDNA-binding domain-containing protein [Bradyrhizobium 
MTGYKLRERLAAPVAENRDAKPYCWGARRPGPREPLNEISDKIVAELEAEHVPWVQPWGTAAAKAPLAMPKNASTIRPYGGANILILWGAVIERGFTGQSWLTFRQALSLGGQVRHGERSSKVAYADRFVPVEEKRRARENGSAGHSIPQAL